MAAGADPTPTSPRRATETTTGEPLWVQVRDTVWRLIVSTVSACLRNRVTGLAAEAAFFALLSLPPLIFGLAGSIGYVVQRFTDSRISEFKAEVVDLALQAFTEDTVTKIIVPTLDDTLGAPRYDVISIGFVLALWSGSRALNVFVDTVTIMYGLGGHRGIVRTRVLSFVLYVLGLLTGIITIPLVVAGPGLVDQILPERLDGLNALYWPAVLVLCICFTATLYHVSVPVRTSWRYNLPGRGAHDGDLGGRLGGAALGADRDGRRLDLDLRSPRGPHRHPHLALHHRHRGAHRRRAQRLLRPAVARVGPGARPDRAGPPPPPARGCCACTGWGSAARTEEDERRRTRWPTRRC